jgi:hypothetical protein
VTGSLESSISNEPTAVVWSCQSCAKINRQPWNVQNIYACVECAANGPFEVVWSSGAGAPDLADLSSLLEGRAILAGDIAAWIGKIRAAHSEPPTEIEDALREIESWMAELDRRLAEVEGG